jgi:NAD dependent epimerase/dehydratase
MPKILITGSAGFIGSHLTEILVKEGFQVRAFVRYNSKNSWGWLDESEHLDNIEVISGDIRDYDSVYKAMAGCDTVFHLSALIGIPYSYISPLAYIKTNVEGTYNILESAKNLNFNNVLITSTSETYGSAQYVPIDENHPLVAQSPYSASKIAADHLALSYYRSFGLPVKIVRPFNNYGPRQSARAIIPTIISQVLAGKEKLKVGNLSPSRDFTFVKDTCSGFVDILKSDKLFGEVTNIGMNEDISIEKLIELITKLIGKDIEVEEDTQRVRPEKSEVDKLVCDNSKIKKFTSWKPAYDLQTGLKETIQWFKDNEYRYKPEVYNV